MISNDCSLRDKVIGQNTWTRDNCDGSHKQNLHLEETLHRLKGVCTIYKYLLSTVRTPVVIK